jgi:hypothetical protein
MVKDNEHRRQCTNGSCRNPAEFKLVGTAGSGAPIVLWNCNDCMQDEREKGYFVSGAFGGTWRRISESEKWL